MPTGPDRRAFKRLPAIPTSRPDGAKAQALAPRSKEQALQIAEEVETSVRGAPVAPGDR